MQRRRTGDPYKVATKNELHKKMNSMLKACNEAGRKKQTPEKENSRAITDSRFVRPDPLRAQATQNVTPQFLSVRSGHNRSASPLLREGSPSGGSSKIKKRGNGVDSLQNCYGRASPRSTTSSPVTTPSPRNIYTPPLTPKSILSKPSTPKSGTGKRVTFNAVLVSTEPAQAQSHVEIETTSSPTALPSVEKKPPTKSKKPPLFQPPNRPTRPSLSEQLSAIADKANDITVDIKLKAGLDHSNPRGEDTPLLSFPAKNFTVGTLQCRYPAPAIFFRDRLEYTFHHPFQASEIRLIIYYKDMQSLALSPNPQPGKMYFRVPRRLVHFASDYDPAKHFVVLYLSSSLSLQSIRSEVMPVIAAATCGSSLRL
mmetsp:Transcript_6753/g.10168  ORF Transcript_6753/g.10168 Transcript_6753/m.10168 type:complete len:369 (-) Transcript_6753:203-1309(-)|eukprot:CAMPEP_0185032704 /NCGR_PEP_ID=MMETSP1103-20130426/21013_1 /TAXON_ID=36769 /ORGANISM="Paraphysomonas bandaiensis, Strain Caron Lab Isolate" /LENGTH=368 /DNA_ID=CAMNT_0027568691 /DNA_START=146 /DNA_END=1252 /DNA_ORIENTATION=+